MKKVAKLLGGGPDSDEQMMKVFELETMLAIVSIVAYNGPRNKDEMTNQLYHKVNCCDWVKRIINWM